MNETVIERRSESPGLTPQELTGEIAVLRGLLQGLAKYGKENEAQIHAALENRDLYKDVIRKVMKASSGLANHLRVRGAAVSSSNQPPEEINAILRDIQKRTEGLTLAIENNKHVLRKDYDPGTREEILVYLDRVIRTVELLVMSEQETIDVLKMHQEK